MRILNEKHLALIWSWDDLERNELSLKYLANIERLVAVIEERISRNEMPPPEDLKDLALELQQAGELLQQCSSNCLNGAQKFYALAGLTTAEQTERRKFIERIKKHVGKPVVLKQTSVDAIRGKQLILEEVRGIKGVLRDGNELWEAMVDFLVPVLSMTPTNTNEPAPKPLSPAATQPLNLERKPG
ncbi:MAG: hypothetical protein WC789_13925 [Lentisphaeria bacterium]|jgi:hypothetical protein